VACDETREKEEQALMLASVHTLSHLLVASSGIILIFD
jgi:hypothetical protein